MFRMYANSSHSYTHLILALGIVKKAYSMGFYYFTKPLAYMTLALGANIMPTQRTTPLFFSLSSFSRILLCPGASFSFSFTVSFSFSFSCSSFLGAIRGFHPSRLPGTDGFRVSAFRVSAGGRDSVL